MDVLIHMIVDAYRSSPHDVETPEAVEDFVRNAFQARNIVPSPELVRQVVDHIVHGAPVGRLVGKTARHCGS